ncbi:phosphatase PAP2 family protein [Streptomyces sp. NPDC055078]
MRYVDCAAADRRLLAALRDCGGRPRVATAARALSFAGEHGALWLATGFTGAAVDRGRRGPWLRATALVGAAHLASMVVKRVVRRPRPGDVPVRRRPVRGVPVSGPPVSGPPVPGLLVRGVPVPVVRSGPVETSGPGPDSSRVRRRPSTDALNGREALLPPLVRTAGRYSFPSSHAASAVAAAVAFGALLPAARRIGTPVAAAMCVSRLVVGVHYPTDIAAGAALGALAARLGCRWLVRPGTGPLAAGTGPVAFRSGAAGTGPLTSGTGAGGERND